MAARGRLKLAKGAVDAARHAIGSSILAIDCVFYAAGHHAGTAAGTLNLNNWPNSSAGMGRSK
jgi:hypothetical protein